MLTSAVAQVTTPELIASQQSGPPITISKVTPGHVRILPSFRRIEPILKGPTTPLACWDCGFESRRGERMSLVSVVCCHVEVSVTGLSLVQRRCT